ncbi:MAG: hypothetical protein LC731_04440, partial [Acidobacteria bacterium]|nr:hypothetical protein [Acidobacteriota bacterium]
TMAERADDVALLSRAMLAKSEALLESNDADNALAAALRAQERLARDGQQESEWRAWLVASRASQLKGDEPAQQQQLARAASILSQLRQNWGAEAFSLYSARHDVQLYLKQLGGAFDTQTN